MPTIITDRGRELYDDALRDVIFGRAILELQRHYEEAYYAIDTEEMEQGFEGGYAAGIDTAISMLKTMQLVGRQEES